MEVKAEFKIRNHDIDGNPIPRNEKERIIKSVVSHLKRQWDVSEFSVYGGGYDYRGTKYYCRWYL